jgi:uncharacterized membrane protein
MPSFAFAYIGAAAVMLVLDALWLTLAVPRIYKPALGDLLLERPNLPAAGLFYLLYVVGVVVLAVLPSVDAKSWLQALALGGLLGLVCYGTYDFTNLATLKGWPLGLTIVDVCWGVVLTSLASLAGFFAVSWFVR